jgi:AraC-like DNA-binding protein
MLLGSLRQQRALALLEDTSLSMSEIAERLGFSDLSSFSQAFKRWFGVSPSHRR